MFLFYLILLIDFLILQPIRIIFGFILRWCWHPKITNEYFYSYDKETLMEQSEKLLESLNRTKYGYDDDSAKFLGMLYFATDSEWEWEKLMSLIQYDGSIKRSLNESVTKSDVPFSGDMLSGFLLAVSKKIHKLTIKERETLTKFWETTSWEGFPMLMSHPVNGKEIFERGHLWRPWWIFGSEDILDLMLWLWMGHLITGKIKYKIAYYMTFFLMFPSIISSCADSQLFIGNVYAYKPSNVHSHGLMLYAGYLLTNSWIFKSALKTALKRHGQYNADIQVLAGLALNQFDETRFIQLVSDCTKKGFAISESNKKYLSLIWPPEFVERYSQIESPMFRGEDYIWERNPLKGRIMVDQEREILGLDVIFPVLVWNKLKN